LFAAKTRDDPHGNRVEPCANGRVPTKLRAAALSHDEDLVKEIRNVVMARELPDPPRDVGGVSAIRLVEVEPRGLLTHTFVRAMICAEGLGVLGACHGAKNDGVVAMASSR
jgi:hypothetical protein